MFTVMHRVSLTPVNGTAVVSTLNLEPLVWLIGKPEIGASLHNGRLLFFSVTDHTF